MTYAKVNWVDGQAPYLFPGLVQMDQGIKDADTALADRYTKAETENLLATASDPVAIPLRFAVDGVQEIVIPEQVTLNAQVRRRMGTLNLTAARSEMLANTIDFTNTSSWVQTAVSTSANTQSNPFGAGTDADTITPSTTSSKVRQTIAANPSGKSYKLGLFVRATVAHTMRLQIIALNGGSFVAGTNFDFTVSTTWSWAEFDHGFGVITADTVAFEIFPDSLAGTNATFAYGASLKELQSLTLPATLNAGDILIATASGVGSSALLTTLYGVG